MYISILLRKRKRRTYYVSMHKPFSTSRRYSTLLQAPRRLRKLNICRFVSKEISDIIFIRLPSFQRDPTLSEIVRRWEGINMYNVAISMLDSAISLTDKIISLTDNIVQLFYIILMIIWIIKKCHKK